MNSVVTVELNLFTEYVFSFPKFSQIILDPFQSSSIWKQNRFQSTCLQRGRNEVTKRHLTIVEYVIPKYKQIYSNFNGNKLATVFKYANKSKANVCSWSNIGWRLRFILHIGCMDGKTVIHCHPECIHTADNICSRFIVQTAAESA